MQHTNHDSIPKIQNYIALEHQTYYYCTQNHYFYAAHITRFLNVLQIQEYYNLGKQMNTQ